MKKPESKEQLRLLEREPELVAALTEPMDAAESRWDPWLLALAKMEALAEAPQPN